jgi:predicted flap endonuclease-1-like 5' DNA nuclease
MVVMRHLAARADRSGPPWENATDESFNTKLPDECLSVQWTVERSPAMPASQPSARRPHAAEVRVTPEAGEVTSGERAGYRSMAKSTHPNADLFPSGVSGPALRALDSAGIRSLADLAKWSEPELARLHGMGPKALGVLKAALKARGDSLRVD